MVLGKSFSDAPWTGLETWLYGAARDGGDVQGSNNGRRMAYVSHNLIEAALLGARAFIVERMANDLNGQVVDQCLCRHDLDRTEMEGNR